VYLAFFCHAPTTVNIQVRFTSEEEALGRKRAEGSAEKFDTKKKMIEAEVKRQFDGGDEDDSLIPGEREALSKSPMNITGFDFVRTNIDSASQWH